MNKMVSVLIGWTWGQIRWVLGKFKPLGKIASAEIDGVKMEVKGTVGFVGAPPTFKVDAEAGGHKYACRYQTVENVVSVTIDGAAMGKPGLEIKEGLGGSVLKPKVWVTYALLWADASGKKHKATFRAEAEVKLSDLVGLPH